MIEVIVTYLIVEHSRLGYKEIIQKIKYSNNINFYRFGKDQELKEDDLLRSYIIIEEFAL